MFFTAARRFLERRRLNKQAEEARRRRCRLFSRPMLEALEELVVPAVTKYYWVGAAATHNWDDTTLVGGQSESFWSLSSGGALQAHVPDSSANDIAVVDNNSLGTCVAEKPFTVNNLNIGTGASGFAKTLEIKSGGELTISGSDETIDLSAGGHLQIDNGSTRTGGGILYVNGHNLVWYSGNIDSDMSQAYAGSLVVSNGNLSMGSPANPTFKAQLWVGYTDHVLNDKFIADTTSATFSVAMGANHIYMDKNAANTYSPNIWIGGSGILALQTGNTAGTNGGYIQGLSIITNYGSITRANNTPGGQELQMQVSNQSTGRITVNSGCLLKIYGDYSEESSNYNSLIQGSGGVIQLIWAYPLNTCWTGGHHYDKV
jgi:hypothetical protein